ncbi:MAG: hypothetical protein RI973_688 [Bacteroidota bacterium]|jgi:RNA polymerase sigma factor (sigma-70 family)
MTQEEFLELINTHQGTIHHLLHIYTEDASEKDDLKQEVILQAWKSKDRFQQQSSFNTWLYKVTLHTILTANRKRAKVKTVEIQEAAAVRQAAEADSDQVERLYRAIAALDDLSKTIVTMHLDGFTNPEIADFMGMTTNNLNVKLHRIREKIANHLKRSTNGH